MTAPAYQTPPAAEHPAEPTPDQSNLAADVAALLLVGAAVSLTAAAIAALLRRRGKRVTVQTVTVALNLAMRTSARPRMRGSEPVVRAQRSMEAFYRAAYVTNAAQRLQAAVDDAVAQAPAEEARQVSADALRAAVARERAYLAAHERARVRRMDAAEDVAAAADLWGPILGWYTHRDDRTTAECVAADGTNFRAAFPPVIGWPGTLHGGTCRCRPGPPHPGGRSTDRATGFG